MPTLHDLLPGYVNTFYRQRGIRKSRPLGDDSLDTASEHSGHADARVPSLRNRAVRGGVACGEASLR